MLRRIVKPQIFSLNFIPGIDDSYPKRVWRLSKNITLKYNKRYWSYCYELKDCLIDYLANSYQTSQETESLWTSRLTKGSPFGQQELTDRLVYVLKEFNKQADFGDFDLQFGPF